jgi:hypothetical protein
MSNYNVTRFFRETEVLTKRGLHLVFKEKLIFTIKCKLNFKKYIKIKNIFFSNITKNVITQKILEIENKHPEH